jgi:NarL family two-component system response regulator LiaR
MEPGTTERLKVFLAEDHAVVREGTREMLERDPSLEVVGEAEDGPRTVSLVMELRPDVVLLDLGLPGLNGIEVTRRLQALVPPPHVLILSAYDDADYVVAASEAGATGYLLKTAHANAVIAAIHAVARGEVVLDPALARELVARASGGAPSRALLSHHELDILGLAARGLRTREIADQIGVSGRTVEAHFTNIFNKLGVTSRTEAIVRAAARGWLTLQDEGSPQLGRQRRQGRLR